MPYIDRTDYSCNVCYCVDQELYTQMMLEAKRCEGHRLRLEMQCHHVQFSLHDRCAQD
jgi:hypothetical protein